MFGPTLLLSDINLRINDLGEYKMVVVNQTKNTSELVEKIGRNGQRVLIVVMMKLTRLFLIS
jgi:hypothetical protein